MVSLLDIYVKYQDVIDLIIFCVFLPIFYILRVELKMEYNEWAWWYLSFCMKHNFPLKERTAIQIWNKEVAYCRNVKINDNRCAISLKTFDGSFSESLLVCGHRFDKESLDKYEDNQWDARAIHYVYKCPVCRDEYLSYLNKWDYDYNHYKNQSLFYQIPAENILLV